MYHFKAWSTIYYISYHVDKKSILGGVTRICNYVRKKNTIRVDQGYSCNKLSDLLLFSYKRPALKRECLSRDPLVYHEWYLAFRLIFICVIKR